MCEWLSVWFFVMVVELNFERKGGRFNEEGDGSYEKEIVGRMI